MFLFREALLATRRTRWTIASTLILGKELAFLPRKALGVFHAGLASMDRPRFVVCCRYCTWSQTTSARVARLCPVEYCVWQLPQC